MLPLYLSIEGLYSYQQKQEIDFSTLTEAGLFGIFGTVGSGKSSVLEAIGYALYGETERLNKKEKRTYNMLNLKSNQAVIDFQFLNFEGRKFRFVAQWKRKKKFEAIDDEGRKAYEFIDGNWVPIESANGALVTNLSYPNFRRTIIIPQGQFKEFLELKGNDRSEMMKEIFYLNQYDLGPKVSNMMADNNKKIEHLKGQLSGFEEVNTVLIEEKKLKYNVLSDQLHDLKKDFDQLNIQFKVLQTAKQTRLDLQNKQEELNVLDQKKSQIKRIENEINEFELVVNNFKIHISTLQSIIASKSILLTKIEGLKESKDATKKSLQEVEIQLEKIIPLYESLDSVKIQNQDLKRLIQNITYSASKVEKIARISKGNEFLTTQKVTEKDLRLSVSALENEISEIKKSKINAAELLAIDNWYQKNEQFLKLLNDENKRLENINTEIIELKSKISALGYEQTNWQDKITTQAQDITNRESILKEQEGSLRLKQELGQYIHSLHNGEPCPLCGSEDHPFPMQIEMLDNEFDILQTKLANLQSEKDKLGQQNSELKLIANIISDKQLSLAKCKNEIATIHSQIEAHAHQFVWNDFDKSNRASFDLKKAEFFQIEEQITQKEAELTRNREQLQKIGDTIIKSERVLSDLQSEVKALEATIEQNLEQMQSFDKAEYSSKTAEELENLVAENTAIIDKTQSEYQIFTQKLLKYNTEYAGIKGAYVEAQEQYSQYTAKQQEIQNLINKLLSEFEYPDIATVKNILDKDLNISSQRNMIQDFYVSYNTLQNRIAELHKLTEEDGYSDQKYDEASNLIVQKKEELEQRIAEFGALKEDLDRLTVELAKKEELLKVYEKLDGRKKNLDILFQMFKGNGFVNYVSSIHLQRLCEIANQRFHRLTKNQLSLVINENNEFEVIDYLNNGYRRSAKTLSGGQSFQASLCLALALAENIQSLNKADKNFFFIDEGFGTQDTESINTVFDTLQYLHQENRVVGIISHVEELKERMPRSITVVKDLEKGSQIVVN